MEINETHKTNIKLLNNREIISDDLLEKLLENCCKLLAGQQEVYDISTLSQVSVTEIKQLYASLLYTYTRLVRNNQTKEEFLNFLLSDCHIDKDRANILEAYYQKWFQLIRIQLLNVGSHLPHITDVRWKIDYVVKSNSVDQIEGPVFQVSLKTEIYDPGLQEPRIEFVEFKCNSQELQDLVYKLKDAVRHCHKLAAGH